MRALIQRVTKASVTVEGNHVGQIGPGLLILLGINKSDELTDSEWLTSKIANLRIFSGDKNNFDYSALDIQAPILLVSQFTLCNEIGEIVLFENAIKYGRKGTSRNPYKHRVSSEITTTN